MATCQNCVFYDEAQCGHKLLTLTGKLSHNSCMMTVVVVVVTGFSCLASALVIPGQLLSVSRRKSHKHRDVLDSNAQPEGLEVTNVRGIYYQVWYLFIH